MSLRSLNLGAQQNHQGLLLFYTWHVIAKKLQTHHNIRRTLPWTHAPSSYQFLILARRGILLTNVIPEAGILTLLLWKGRNVIYFCFFVSVFKLPRWFRWAACLGNHCLKAQAAINKQDRFIISPAVSILWGAGESSAGCLKPFSQSTSIPRKCVTQCQFCGGVDRSLEGGRPGPFSRTSQEGHSSSPPWLPPLNITKELTPQMQTSPCQHSGVIMGWTISPPNSNVEAPTSQHVTVFGDKSFKT